MDTRETRRSEPDYDFQPTLSVGELRQAIVEKLIHVVGKDPIAAAAEDWLHAAAYAGNLDIVKRLVAEGAAVNDTQNFYHMSPLHAAAEEGHADVAAFLVANNANIEATERNGYTPLTQAGWRGYWDVGEMLIKAGATCQKAELVGEPLYKECIKRKSP